MSGLNIESDEHDRAVRKIAATRFPFPDQADWPPDYVTLTNQSVRRRGVPGPNGTDYPDIVVVDGTGAIREIGEIEQVVDKASVPRWGRAAGSCDAKTKSGVRHFFLYVPPGSETEARSLLEDYDISFAGLRTWSIAIDGHVTIIPIVTPGDPKDHR